ncbi:hypothetical protein OC842_005753 [Tilletia horrida]|uniref:ABC transporter domain-containing protein n=1 Tax=Tilletia horrida TaxID=155126 RepID=A0AAN6G9T0_9BASI|nr:hypothetical protein OC842_005753 [Tilletia horrida]
MLRTSGLPSGSSGIGGVISIVSGATDILPTSGVLPTSGLPGASSGIDAAVTIVSGATNILPNFVFIYIYKCCWSCFGERLVRKPFRQDMAYLDQSRPGEVNSRLSTDLLTIQTGTNETCVIFISSLSYFITSYNIAFVKLPTLAAQPLALLPAFHGIQPSSTASSHLAHANCLGTEAFSDLPSVPAFAPSANLSYIYEKHLELAHKAGTLRAAIAALQMGSPLFVGYSANALAFFSGSRIISAQSDSSTGTVGNVYTVIFLLLDASFIVGQITPYLQTFQSAGGVGQHILKIINKQSPIDAMDLDKSLKPESTAFTMLGFSFRKVTFAYPMRPDVIVAKNLSLDIEPGAQVGICGTSGSGKRTVVALCQRFYDPSAGEVLLHGHDLREYNVRCPRSHIGVVGQEPPLFDADVMQTIAHGLTGSPSHEHLKDALEMLSDGTLYGLLDADEVDDPAHEIVLRHWVEIERLCKEAARLANAHECIEYLPKGYRNNLGDDDGRFSAGQKQRLALARAIFKQPHILILYETTAAVASISEQLVQAPFEKVSASRTTITVAHRLSMLRSCDKIVVMSQGGFVDSVAHDELMDAKGRYCALAMAQNAASAAAYPQASTPTSQLKGALNTSDDDDTIAADDRGSVRSLSVGGKNAARGTGSGGHHAEPRVRSIFSRLVMMLSPYWLLIAVGFATSTVIGSSYSAEAVIFGNRIDALCLCGGPERVRSQGALFALLFFVLALVQLCAYSLNGASFGYVSERFVLTIRKTAFKARIRQHISWFQEQGRSAGTMVAALSSDTASIAGLTGTVMETIFSVSIISSSASRSRTLLRSGSPLPLPPACRLPPAARARCAAAAERDGLQLV